MRHGGRRRAARGMSLMELVVSFALLLLLFALVLNLASHYALEAERVTVAQNVGALRSALELRTAELVVKGKEAEVRLLAGQNPMPWLRQRPANYLGEYYAPQPGDIAPGHWYFERNSKMLIYLGREVGFSEGLGRLRFQVRMTGTQDPDANGAGLIDGVALVQLGP